MKICKNSSSAGAHPGDLARIVLAEHVRTEGQQLEVFDGEARFAIPRGELGEGGFPGAWLDVNRGAVGGVGHGRSLARGWPRERCTGDYTAQTLPGPE